MINLETADVIVQVISVVEPIKHGVPLFRVKMIKGSEIALKPVWTSGKDEHDDPFLVPNLPIANTLASSLISFAIPSQDEADTASIHPRQLADLLSAESWAAPSRPGSNRVGGQVKEFKAGLWKPWDVIELGGGMMQFNAINTVLLCSRYLIIRDQI
jgi:hypothetical protein